jgi:hypothetical protein
MAKRKANPAKRKKNKVASNKIKKYVKEGYPQKQAVAMGLKYAKIRKKKSGKKKA